MSPTIVVIAIDEFRKITKLRYKKHKQIMNTMESKESREARQIERERKWKMHVIDNSHDDKTILEKNV